MNGLLSRSLQSIVASALRRFHVVVVTGARQTGKSTLVRDLLTGPRRLYETLDDLDILERAQKAPDALLVDAARLTLDEVQQAPDLLRAIKRSVDRRRRPGRFLLVRDGHSST